MPRRLRTTLIWMAGVSIAVLVTALLLRAVARPQPPPPLPNPNGYDSFVQAGALASLPATHFTDLSHEALRAVIQTNNEALRLLRVGLTQKTIAPRAAFYYTNSLQSLARLKGLAQLLAAEGRLAELEDRPADAARSYVDCIRLGNESSRGGVLIQRLVGVACEGIGYQPLVKILPKLGDAELRELTSGVEEIRRACVPWEEVWCAEKRQSHTPFRSRLTEPLQWKTKALFRQKDSGILAQLTLLTVELALRSYVAENGKPPAQLNELTPKFLKDIPPDPFNGKPLVYRPQGTNWLLYSVGPDRVDSGGVPVIRRSSKQVSVGLPFFSINVPAGDVFYDSTW